MNQSINLLKALPKKNIRLSASIIGWATLLTLVILVIITVSLFQINAKEDKTLAEVEKELQMVQQEYDKLVKKYPLLVSDLPLEKQIKDLEENLQAKKDELNFLEHIVFRRGFSQYMYDLAQVTPNTLWLSDININHESKSINLNGYVMNHHTVAEFMHKLVTTPSFKDDDFNLFFVKTVKNHSYLKFSIATKELELEKEENLEQMEQSNKKLKE